MTGIITRPLVLLCVVLGLSGCVTKENYTKETNRANSFQRLLAEEEKRGVELSSEIAKLKDEKVNLEAKNKTLTAQLNDTRNQVVRSLEEVGRLQDEVKQSRGGFSSAPAARGPSQEPPDRLSELQGEDVGKKTEKKKEKGKATAQVKVLQQSPAPSPAPPQPPAPVLRAPSQEPPDRLSELQAAPAGKPEKKVEKKTGKETAQVRVLKQGQEPSQPQPKAAPQASPPPAPPPPVSSKVQVKTEAAPDESFFRYHKVKKGETLAGIAKQYKTDAQTLRELNDMAANEGVKPGDRLIVGQKQ